MPPATPSTRGSGAKSQASRPCEEIDGRLEVVLEPQIEGDGRHRWIDATDLKVRRCGRMVPVVRRVSRSAPRKSWLA